MKVGYKDNKKVRYITQKEIDEIEAAIYNGTFSTLYEDIPEVMADDYITEEVKEFINGTEYIHLEDAEEYIILKDGRVLNCKTPKLMQIQFAGVDIRVYIKRNKVMLKDYFEKKNWEYDRIKILKNYKKNKWPVAVTDSQKSFFDSL